MSDQRIHFKQYFNGNQPQRQVIPCTLFHFKGLKTGLVSFGNNLLMTLTSHISFQAFCILPSAHWPTFTCLKRHFFRYSWGKS